MPPVGFKPANSRLRPQGHWDRPLHF